MPNQDDMAKFADVAGIKDAFAEQFEAGAFDDLTKRFNGVSANEHGKVLAELMDAKQALAEKDAEIEDIKAHYETKLREARKRTGSS